MAGHQQTEIPKDAPPSYEALSVLPKEPQLGVPPRRLRPPPPLELPALTYLRGKRVILASQSPRRKQLLAQIGLTNIEILPSNFEENLPKLHSPFEYVLATATQKALDVYKQEVNNEEKGEPALIIAADTIVVSSLGEILEKPRSEVHHITMLKTLRDTSLHKVYTAVAVIMPLESARDPGYALETATEETTVKFDPEITDELLLAYVRTREGADKAGGYGIQGTGAILVEKIEGSFDNVVGLPLRTTLKLIERAVAKSDDEDTMGDEDLLEDE
ncbi:septum formation protein Maf [Rhinocladiella mackenziei CBS 650.93]|uniref:Rhinocladiella mackenziei CBS 650.93 unplaced genomic scaffold supercont1.2, whole genome shotgun sequence n=1 Tax=Rhinocladiella mackenziei CBS 650.93 TaxID=1442369 RepID=A0A0D2HAX0_9EURO|nr:septum formation protein Maf [Rhinocladiella mackenziei CBS 650.93]KIX07588.1 septum formation protein Maf [Rhinocladiella mackenziei CBS 650.93]